MSDLKYIFATGTPPDFGLEKIYLTPTGLAHIEIGHRDISLYPHTLLKEAVEKTTRVYPGHIPGRLVFMADGVTTKHGRPMIVVIERKSDGGEIITASWKDKASAPIIWDSTSGLYASLDKDSDILYVSRGPATVSYAVEDNDDPDIWYRYSDEDDSPTGITIFRVLERRKGKFAELAKQVSSFLGLSENQIGERLASVMS